MLAARLPGTTPAATRFPLDDLLERLLVLIASASLAGIALGLLGGFSAPLVVAIAVLCTWLYHRLVPMRASAGLLRAGQVLAVLLVALLLRLPPHPYVLAGQDQGVYMNMAAELVRTHDIAVVDPEIDRLAGVGALPAYLAGNYDFYLPGVYPYGDVARPRLVFQFYHLFPVWLALFGGLFGLAASAYALTFLSLVSVLFFQRLATQLSASARVGTAAGLLLALNPLHAFFSKFPVTEVPTLAFSCAAFAFLAMYAGAGPDERRARWLVLSALAMSCLFLTRISGFMYLPLVLSISIVPLVLDEDRGRARALSLWALATVLAYIGSVAYGLRWSKPYSLKIYEESFSLLLGPGWPRALLAASALVAFAWLLAWRWPDGPFARLLRGIAPRLARLMGPALLLVLAYGGYKAYQLGFTTRFAADPWLARFPGVVGQGWQSLAHSSLVVVAMYLSPWLFLAFLAIAQIRLPVAGRYLLLFLCCFGAYAALLNWTVPYQPYYARYFVSELVPYALLFVTCAWAWMHRPLAKRLLAAGLGLAGIYFLVLSSLQVGKTENLGARESIGALASLAGDGDVILLDRSASPGMHPLEVKPALIYTFARHVISVDDQALADVGYMAALAKAYDQVLLASTVGTPPPGFTPVGRVRLHALGFGRTAGPPRSLRKSMDAMVHVSRLDHLPFGIGQRLEVELDTAGALRHPVGQQRGGWGIVADGRAGWLLLGPEHSLPEGGYQVVLHGSQPEGAGPIMLELLRNGGAQPVGQAQAEARPSPGGALASMEFEVEPGGVPDLRVRVGVEEGSRAVLRDYTILRIR